MRLKRLLNNISFTGKYDNRDILYITHDSRKVKKGTLFIALKGAKSDGHDYIFDAIRKGAIAVVANGRAPSTNQVPIIQVENPRRSMSKIACNFFKNPSKSLNIIGVTGTNGKTTTTQIINHILNFNNLQSGSLGTLGFNSPTGIKSTRFTTPESVELHHILKIMKNGGINYIPMEVSSHAMEMNRIDDIKLKIAIFTNLGFDHLDFHKNQENYFLAKEKLFKKLDENSLAILNIDDKYFERLKDSLKCNFLSYGFNKKADLYIQNFSLNFNNTIAEFIFNKNKYKFKTNLIGQFNLYNIMASILCCIKIGIDIHKIIEAINNFYHVPGRFEKFKLPKNKGYAIVDYAHSPDAFENIYKNLIEISSNKKIITVFGCGGERDKKKRSMMAKLSEKFSLQTIVTNDNPRHENPDKIIKDITNGFKKNNYLIIKDRKEAIEYALSLSKNCIVAILGKGIEEYQIIKNRKIPHSDIDVIKNFINENRD